ncbi:Myo-inositol 2-dehydrogenase [Klebsiella pneumoniae]|uniref:Myo-inositol 2-dehydrogenase n=1 Tax=Klebsiella pneumoniae TaxID=573 RepID=A0A2X3C824_KLEPN|nr:Myo-inositol 2-dehydrogenase [Klebsiella pneumoniae]
MWCDYAPKYDVIRQLLEDGALGDLHTLLADHGEYFTRDHRIFNADLAGGPMMDLGSYVTSFALMVGGIPQEIVARGSATAEGLNGQTSMLFSWQNGMQGLLNTTLFSNTPGGAVVAGRQATLTIDGQFYAPGGFTLAASQGGRCCAGRAAQSLRPAVLAGGAFCLVHRTGGAGLAAAAAQSGAAESAGDG